MPKLRYRLLLPLLLLLGTSYAQVRLTSDSVLIDGNYRTFHFHKPQVPRTNASLVFVLHGSGGNGIQMAERAARLEEKSSSENFIAVYPDGYKRFWNECRKVATTEAN